VSVLLMKAAQRLSGGAMTGLHLVSLALHLATAFMVLSLCLQLTQQRFWSVFGAILFALYTHTIIPVAWLASQNAVLQTALTVAALLLYVRASGLELGPDSAPRAAVPPLHAGWFAGGWPPVAWIVWPYAVPSVASGSGDAVAIESGVGTVRMKIALAFSSPT
jgi:hypothetical protein